MKKVLTVLALVAGLAVCADTASARSWWGTGYRNPEWVLAHGGTVVYYEIIANGANDRYKAVMYQGGKYVEVENGKKGKFDDPKNGTYDIKIYLGGVERHKTPKGGKKIMGSGPIAAHPGETIRVVFNVKTDEVKITSDRRVAKPAPSKKIVPIAMENKKTAQAVQPESSGVEKTIPGKSPAIAVSSGDVCTDPRIFVEQGGQKTLWAGTDVFNLLRAPMEQNF